MTKEEISVSHPEDILLQKNRFSLLCSGNALVTFAIWTLIRSLIQLYFFLQTDLATQNQAIKPVALIAVALGGIDLVLKLFVGLSARAEGKGQHKGNAFLILGIVLAVLTVIWLISQIPLIPYYYRSDGLLNVLISLAVEVTVLFAELDLVVAAWKVRRIEAAATTDNETLRSC